MWLFLSCMFIAGITALEGPTMQYQVKGGSVCLHVRKSGQIKSVRWQLNETLIVMEKDISPLYKHKVNYSSVNHSMCIIKLNETDSGVYKVSMVDLDFKESTENYRLIVQEVVPSPAIKMLALDFNSSAGFCKVSVNCSVLHDWLTAICDEDSCRTVQTSFSVVNIIIHAQNRSVVCIGNNHVSSANVSQSMEGKCYNKSNHYQVETYQTYIPLIILALIVVCVVTCALLVIIYVAKRACSEEHRQHQMPPTRIIQSQQIEAQPQPLSRDSTSFSSHPDASYENVDAVQEYVFTGYQTSSPTGSQNMELQSQQSYTVDSVYSVIELKHMALGKNASSNDTAVEKTIQEPSTSANLGDAEQSSGVYTVYNVLKKSKK